MSGRQRLLVRTFCILLCLWTAPLSAEDGYRLWLRYDLASSPARLFEYRSAVREIVFENTNDCHAGREELQSALSTLLGVSIPVVSKSSGPGSLIVGTPDTSRTIAALTDRKETESLGTDGYLIRSSGKDSRSSIIVAANGSRGLLYGVFHLLRLIQTQQSIRNISIIERPRLQLRLLNHWDNLDGSVERGYAGKSIWDWDRLPQEPTERIRDYARANASIGINGTVLNNVNSQAEVLTAAYLEKAAAIADILRPWGIRVYLSIKCTSPIEIDGLSTADPLDPAVRQWWNTKVNEVYRRIPDFGGFLVKAYSEGQPGPQQYGRTHADGANMLAEALRPFGGVVMWRAFVYDLSIDADRTKCAYLEFVPLDGQFGPNAFVQVKNGPIDFQPREPFNPLFGAMPKTPLMMELQITQEYTGQAKHLVYLAPQWKEVLDSNTYAYGDKTPVATIIDGTAEGHAISGIAGVSGVGQDRNWTGHHFSQANWYAFGRLAWDPDLTSERIADEWIRMTWSNDEAVVKTIQRIVSGSWQACVNYMTPMGLHHLMAEGHHYGPQPDYVHPGRHDWSSTYYHRADRSGIGFDRSTSGTGAVTQYHSPLRNKWNSVETCPVDDLLWFHHAAWSHPLAGGRTVWEELQSRYQQGVKSVGDMRKMWESLETQIDAERFEHVRSRLDEQYENACQWREVCLAYFGQFAAPLNQ
jgi:alpha-glucuronidase